MDVVKLNVGGTVFETTRSTLTKYDGFFRGLFESGIPPTLNESGCIFIDRSPKHFDFILNFLRDADTPIPEPECEKRQLLKEAEYYMLDGLIYLCGGEPSEEWKKANLDVGYLRDWRGANLRGDILFTVDDEEHKDFCRYCKDKYSLRITYSESAWGKIHENPHVQNFVKKYGTTWNILFFHLDNKWPKYFIDGLNRTIGSGPGESLPSAKCDAFLERVEETIREEFPESVV